MFMFLGILSFLLFLVMLVVSINPKWISRGEKKYTRKQTLLSAGVMFVLFCIFAINDGSNNSTAALSPSTSAVTAPVKTPEQIAIDKAAAEAKATQDAADKVVADAKAKVDAELKAKQDVADKVIADAKAAEDKKVADAKAVADKIIADKAATEKEAINNRTLSQKNAIRQAEGYLDYTAFSESGLIKQLEYGGFSKEDAIFGVKNIKVDWKEQAVKQAESYLDYSSFSRSGLIKQLEYGGHSRENANYAATQVGF